MPQTLLGYRRKSQVRNEVDLVSPERQTRACELWVEMQGGEYVLEWYEDAEGHRSARDEKNRPGWQALLRQLDRPDVVGVIADSFDRMYRNVHQFLTFLNQVEQRGLKLITVKESLDTGSHLGRAVVTILMVIYQLESDQTSERMARMVEHLRTERGRHWGPTPFGCDRDERGQLIPTTGVYWLNPLTGEVGNSEVGGWERRYYYDALTAVYRLYAEGVHSYDAVAAGVNADGWRYRANQKGAEPRPFTRSDVRRLVSFWRLYRGELPIGNITNNRGQPVLAGGHDPILPVELCDRVGTVKQKRSRSTWNRVGNRPKYNYLLSDVLYCSKCNQRLRGYHQDGKRRYRHQDSKRGCPEIWLLADPIEAEVLDALVRLGQNTPLLDEIAAEARRLAEEVFSQTAGTRRLYAELERQRARLTRLEDLYLDGEIDRARYRTRKADIDRTIAELEDRLYAGQQALDFDAILQRMTSLLAELPQASPETKKTLINSVIQRLEIGEGAVTRLVPHSWAAPFF